MSNKRKAVDDDDAVSRLVSQTPPVRIREQLDAALFIDGMTSDLVSIVAVYVCYSSMSFGDVRGYIDQLQAESEKVTAEQGALEAILDRLSDTYGNVLDGLLHDGMFRDIFPLPDSAAYRRHRAQLGNEIARLETYDQRLTEQIIRLDRFMRMCTLVELPSNVLWLFGRSMADPETPLLAPVSNSNTHETLWVNKLTRGLSDQRIQVQIGQVSLDCVLSGAPRCIQIAGSTLLQNRLAGKVQFTLVDFVPGMAIRVADLIDSGHGATKWEELLSLGCTIDEAVFCLVLYRNVFDIHAVTRKEMESYEQTTTDNKLSRRIRTTN